MEFSRSSSRLEKEFPHQRPTEPFLIELHQLSQAVSRNKNIDMVDKVRPVTKIIDLNSTLLLFTLPILPTSPAVPSPPPPTPVSLDRVIIVALTG